LHPQSVAFYIPPMLSSTATTTIDRDETEELGKALGLDFALTFLFLPRPCASANKPAEEDPPEKVLLDAKKSELNLVKKEFDEEGKLSDGMSGMRLSYFGARYYDAEIGVWTSPDPLEQDWNLYGYCGNNPISRTDPFGLSYQDEYNAQWNQEAYEEVMRSFLLSTTGTDADGNVIGNVTSVDRSFYRQFVEQGSSDEPYSFLKLSKEYGEAKERERSSPPSTPGPIAVEDLGPLPVASTPDWPTASATGVGGNPDTRTVTTTVAGSSGVSGASVVTNFALWASWAETGGSSGNMAWNAGWSTASQPPSTFRLQMSLAKNLPAVGQSLGRIALPVSLAATTMETGIHLRAGEYRNAGIEAATGYGSTGAAMLAGFALFASGSGPWAVVTLPIALGATIYYGGQQIVPKR